MNLIHHMTIIRYYRDGRPWDSEDILNPEWSKVEEAIRKMDNYCYPIVQLNLTEYDDDEEIFNIIGGDGRWAMFHMMGDWYYEDPSGSDEEVRLWESDQGYFCRERNVITDIEKVLRVTKEFYSTGSYSNLSNIK